MAKRFTGEDMGQRRVVDDALFRNRSRATDPHPLEFGKQWEHFRALRLADQVLRDGMRGMRLPLPGEIDTARFHLFMPEAYGQAVRDDDTLGEHYPLSDAVFLRMEDGERVRSGEFKTIVHEMIHLQAGKTFSGDASSVAESLLQMGYANVTYDENGTPHVSCDGVDEGIVEMTMIQLLDSEEVRKHFGVEEGDPLFRSLSDAAYEHCTTLMTIVVERLAAARQESAVVVWNRIKREQFLSEPEQTLLGFVRDSFGSGAEEMMRRFHAHPDTKEEWEENERTLGYFANLPIK